MRYAIALIVTLGVSVPVARYLWLRDRADAYRSTGLHAGATIAAHDRLHAGLETPAIADDPPPRSLRDLGIIRVTTPEQAAAVHAGTYVVAQVVDPDDAPLPAVSIDEAREHSPAAGAPPRLRLVDELATAARHALDQCAPLRTTPDQETPTS